MKKQIVYASFVSRVFAMAVDLLIIIFVTSPVTALIARPLFAYFLGGYFPGGLAPDVLEQNYDQELARNFTNALTSIDGLKYFLAIAAVNITILGLYFVGFWRAFQATPGKILMRQYIVRDSDLQPPSTWQLTRRFVGYSSIIIGIWRLFFSDKNQAGHDLAAGTIVIKR